MTTSSLAKPAALAALLAAAASVSGCGGMSSALGADKNVPDEFRVVTRAPLVLPPDYSLRPPLPGQPRPQELQPNEEARTALFGQDLGQDATQGERALVSRAGAETTDATIRDTVDFEGANLVHRDEAFVNRVLASQGAAADATAGAQSTEEQESIRRVTGGAAVTIEHRETGFKLPGT
ncbi:MAG: DUF3035 domain-containing protein [Hyphomonadaceae bacterium]